MSFDQNWFLASLYRDKTCRICSGVCGVVSHGQLGVQQAKAVQSGSQMAVPSMKGEDSGLLVARQVMLVLIKLWGVGLRFLCT